MPPVIDVSELRKTYTDGAEALKGITFSVDEGEFFGFLGPNGAGKSTTIKILITLLAPDRGGARVFGHDVGGDANADPHADRLRGAGSRVDDELTGRENLAAGQLYHMRGRCCARVDELLDLVDLPRTPTGRQGRTPAACESGSTWQRD